MSDNYNLVSSDIFMAVVLSFLNRPYIWGGDDPSGIDCSGLVVEGLKAIGFLKEDEDYSAKGLFELIHSLATKQKVRFGFDPTKLDRPKRGAIIFFSNNNNSVFHCSIALNDYFQIGAIGGKANTISVGIANQQNAFVKIRPILVSANLSFYSIFK